MYYLLFRLFPKRALTRLMGAVADARWPRPLLDAAIRLYTRLYRIDMTQYEAPPAEGWGSFNRFFVRPLRPGAREIDTRPPTLVSPVDGRVSESGRVVRGRLLQAKGRDYGLEALLAGTPGWEAYEGGTFLTLYLAPGDYHRFHAPCAGQVVRYTYVPGELWSVSPRAVRSVPGLFARNERLVTTLATDFGELTLVAVGATVVGRIEVVYPADMQAAGAPEPRALEPPVTLEKGAELGRFAMGSTVILLARPGEAVLEMLPGGQRVEMGDAVGRVVSERPAVPGAASAATPHSADRP